MKSPGTLLLIRHAETNLAGTFCGFTDPPINERGYQQIQTMLEELRSYELDVVYTSDLRRARATAEAIVNQFAIPLRVNPDLREIGFGDWETLTWEQIERRDPEHAQLWVAAFPNLPAPEGEEFSTFEERILRAFDQLSSAGASAAVVTHGGVLRVVLTRRFGLNDEEAWKKTKNYCGIFVCPSSGVSA